ncbi:uncharacterized protein AB675_6617 [Cyphellophora attinorum]|uniref:Uncharacterized protein n=1 Tax=Cyphellophora attinorum TaxID=1664694 RepID=A0A0N1HVJ4_9EURO|nr:uncharacterized protein AB675_6617 [Phialophora attinorum]KPI43843.1 hypothetical protein AB675_6617 [Phialophora attinorum]
MPSQSANILCRGDNVKFTGGSLSSIAQPTPINAGSYHGRKVAFDSRPNKIFAILCNERAVNTAATATLPFGTTTVNGIASSVIPFESCIQSCGDYTPPATSSTSCVGVVWVATAQTPSNAEPSLGRCVGSVSYQAENPPPVDGAAGSNTQDQVRGARLLDSAVPNRGRVNDAIYFQSNVLGVDLSLCGTDGRYDGAWVNVQQRLGAFRAGNSMSWLISCSKDQSFAGTTAFTDVNDRWTRTSAGGLNQPGPGPKTADDCLRMCAWIQREGGGTTTCKSWEWGPPTSGLLLASGGLAAGEANFNALTSWKRSIFDQGAIGRYKRDLWAEERSEDWMKPDLVLPG